MVTCVAMHSATYSKSDATAAAQKKCKCSASSVRTRARLIALVLLCMSAVSMLSAISVQVLCTIKSHKREL